MLECFGEFNKLAAERGKGMRHLPPAISFVKQARPHQPMRMLRNIFKVGIKFLGNLLYRDSFIFLNGK